MALTSVDEREILLPLVAGINEAPVWETFLRRLLVRTRAHRACLLVRTTQMAEQKPLVRMTAAAGHEREPDFTRLEQLGLVPLATMRRDRAYALQETVSPQLDDLRRRQRAALGQAGISHARFIRVRSAAGHEAWLVLTHASTDFAAADSALLTALAPHLAIVLDLVVELDALRLRAGIAEDALALLDVQQAALDEEGRPVELAEPQSSRRRTRLPVAPRDANLLAVACKDIAGKPAAERRFVSLGPEERGKVLVRPRPNVELALPTPAVAAAIARTGRRRAPAAAARVIADTLGLSLREAALAEAISRGQSIVEAGATLQLTPETARNYTKRIYAKTGAAGQADLVRMVLTGLAPLA